MTLLTWHNFDLDLTLSFYLQFMDTIREGGVEKITSQIKDVIPDFSGIINCTSMDCPFLPVRAHQNPNSVFPIIEIHGPNHSTNHSLPQGNGSP